MVAITKLVYQTTFLLLLWILAGAIPGYFIGEMRGRGRQGALLGACLGPLGWILVSLLPFSPEKQAEYEEQVAAAHAARRERAGRGDAPANSAQPPRNRPTPEETERYLAAMRQQAADAKRREERAR